MEEHYRLQTADINNIPADKFLVWGIFWLKQIGVWFRGCFQLIINSTVWYAQIRSQSKVSVHVYPTRFNAISSIILEAATQTISIWMNRKKDRATLGPIPTLSYYIAHGVSCTEVLGKRVCRTVKLEPRDDIRIPVVNLDNKGTYY